jgi:hypothetical protein
MGVCLQIESQNQLHGGVLRNTYRVCVSILVVAGGRQSRSTTAAIVCAVRASNQPGRADRPTPPVRLSAGPFVGEDTHTGQTNSLPQRALLSSQSGANALTLTQPTASCPTANIHSRAIHSGGRLRLETHTTYTYTQRVLFWRRMVINFHIGWREILRHQLRKMYSARTGKNCRLK